MEVFSCFFFSSRRRHTRSLCDWSSDVCSSDLSGAMIESVVRRAKKLALKRYIAGGQKGIMVDDLLTAVREEFKENEDLPNTTNPDDWAKIAGKKGERIVYVKPLMGETKEKLRSVERVVNTGQYL